LYSCMFYSPQQESNLDSVHLNNKSIASLILEDIKHKKTEDSKALANEVIATNQLISENKITSNQTIEAKKITIESYKRVKSGVTVLERVGSIDYQISINPESSIDFDPNDITRSFARMNSCFKERTQKLDEEKGVLKSYVTEQKVSRLMHMSTINSNENELKIEEENVIKLIPLSSSAHHKSNSSKNVSCYQLKEEVIK